MLKIGEFSKLSRISIRMLRYYNEMGLLVPENTDSFTGYRYYSESQLPIANRITSLKDMGFSLAVVKEILFNYNDVDKLKTYFLVKETELKEEVKSMNQKLLLLENMIERLGKDDIMMKYNVVLKELPERTVASVRKVIPSYDQEGILWNILMKETQSLQIQPDEPCYTLAVFHDAEHKEENVDVEIQKSVKGTYQNTENVIFKKVPAVQMASATYKGSYENITEVNEAVANWVQENGYEFDGVSFSIYHVSPYDTKNTEEYVTEVCYPVKKK